ncbi:geranylgeranyl reductase family protein [Roseicyclus mahoneyensis]|uniref:Geranylgeranyl reductase family protein n=1 Tax=Roseicyclus mahoneyensis TaxID=164332 RepID=A0A316GW15_9RHOB|nr:geranylgeranyl reductase family protein [Roseicyclus mahoneyensis]PWK59277.1 geranylgeranyl reductase family protein [Roseicyclus mahoneyensis]
MPVPASHDVVILGGGPAGSAAATTAARLGLRVVVIDKARFPRDKLCGGLFTGRARGEYVRIFGCTPDPGLFEERRAISFHLGDRTLSRMEDVPPMYLTMRRSLDAHLLSLAAQAGAELRTGCRVADIDLAAERVVLEDGTTLAYRVLIGADGVTSAVARTLFGRPFDPKKIGFALEKEMPPQTDADVLRTVRVDFGAAEWGYGWSFPKRASTTVGVGGLHRLNPDMKARLHDYAALLQQGDADGMKGHFLPFGDHRRRPGRGNVLLAGDAAGFVDPITGEGIGHALTSGRLAAEAAVLALREGRQGDAAAVYRMATRDLRHSLATARMLRPIVFSSGLAPMFLGGFGASGTMRHAYLAMLAGDCEYGQILGLLARRLPLKLWQHYRQRRTRPNT